MADRATYVADTSAWHWAPRDAAVFGRWAAAVENDRVALTPMVRLELLYSARSGSDYARLTEELDRFPRVPAGETVFARAEQVQGMLARRSALHHRSVQLPDLIIAAAAELAGVTVWHYDEDYDRIAEVTGQPTEWLAPRGSL